MLSSDLKPSGGCPHDTRLSIRSLKPGLDQASDDQIVRVTALVDRMPERGAADELLVPLRPRLAQLRIPRVLNFSRMLFLPLDPLIVPPSRWQLGQPAFPRSALAVLSRVVHGAMGEAARAVDVALAGHTSGEPGPIAQFGALLWPAASRILAQAIAPADWPKTGLTPGAFKPIAREVAGLLRHAVVLHAIAARPEEATREQVQRLILTASAAGDEVRTMLTILLLTQTSRPDLVLGATPRPNGDRAATDIAVDLVIDGMAQRGEGTGALASGPSCEAADEAARLAELLDGLGNHVTNPDRRRRLDMVRAGIDAACRARFDDTLDATILDGLGEPGADAGALETAARDLRRLEQSARRIGSPRHYDGALARAAAGIRAGLGVDTLPLADRIRMVELLAGPDEALAMLPPIGALTPA